MAEILAILGIASIISSLLSFYDVLKWTWDNTPPSLASEEIKTVKQYDYIYQKMKNELIKVENSIIYNDGIICPTGDGLDCGNWNNIYNLVTVICILDTYKTRDSKYNSYCQQLPLIYKKLPSNINSNYKLYSSFINESLIFNTQKIRGETFILKEKTYPVDFSGVSCLVPHDDCSYQGPVFDNHPLLKFSLFVNILEEYPKETDSLSKLTMLKVALFNFKNWSGKK
jgi:hypothetical protein